MINNLSMNMKLDKIYSPYNHIYKSILSKLHCIYNLTSSYLLVYKKKHVRKAKGKKNHMTHNAFFFIQNNQQNHLSPKSPILNSRNYSPRKSECYITFNILIQ